MADDDEARKRPRDDDRSRSPRAVGGNAPRPPQGRGKPAAGRPQRDNKARDGQRDGQPRDGQPRAGKQRDGKQRDDRPRRDDKPFGNKPAGARNAFGSKPEGDRGPRRDGDERPRGPRRDPDGPRTMRSGSSSRGPRRDEDDRLKGKRTASMRADDRQNAKRAAGRETTRSIAIEALVRADEGGFANVDLPVRLRRSRLDQRDKDWVTNAVYGTLRTRRYLDALLEPCSARPLHALDASVRAALRLGAYQFVNGVAPHAAVMETVKATQPSAQKYVNGALRALGRSGPPWPTPTDDGTALSYPDWIIESFIRDFGDEDGKAALAAMNEPGAVTLRVNPLRGNAEAIMQELANKGGTVERGELVDEALIVKGFGDLGTLRSVREGRVSPQDQASQAIVAILDPQPGERVLDIASAPGGKACAAAERMNDDGLVVAADIHAGRLRLVREAAGRLHLDAIQAVVATGTEMAFPSATFDRVLLDAPCSGLGVLRRRPEARWRLESHQIENLAALQCTLLASAADAVKVGGRLVFSVCTLSQAETMGVDEWARAELPNFIAIDPPPAPWRAWGRGALILPHDAATDGMFVLALTRTS